MSLFGEKSKEQKQVEAEQKQKQLELEEQIVNALKEIYVFPGTKSEFEDFIGYQTVWVDLGKRNLGILYNDSRDNPFSGYDFDFQKKIVDSGVVALVNANFNHSNSSFDSYARTHYYGMPVKRK